MDIKSGWVKPLLRCAETAFIINEETKIVEWTNAEPSLVGMYCWQAFFGRNEPCTFCPKLKEGEFYAWEFYDRNKKMWIKIKNTVFKDEELLLRACNLNVIDDVMRLNHESVEEISFLQKLLRDNKQIKERLEKEANFDAMTGLFNRNRFNLDISSDYYDGAKTGVLYFDLNNLKLVNDVYRHETGDRLICRLAEAITETSNKTPDSRCYRIGGDEFVLIIRKCEKKLLDNTKEIFYGYLSEKNKEEPPCITAVGVAYSEIPCEIELLISSADKSMYEDKKRLKGQKAD